MLSQKSSEGQALAVGREPDVDRKVVGALVEAVG
tara:strand:+ start:318 stop:419 length:102 start_codon:yes stop_codon:yes gene_type:complete